MSFFLQGLIMGIVVCTAPGPILAIIFREGLKRGFKFAFQFGMGVALVDFVFCILAFSGISQVVSARPDLLGGMWLIGGFVLLFVGVFDIYKMVVSHGHLEEADKYKKMDYSNPFVKGLVISALNPGAFLFWISISAAFTQIGGQASHLFIAGVAFGSPVWFFILAHLIARLRTVLSEKFLYYFTFFSGSLLVCVSGYFFYKFFTMM